MSAMLGFGKKKDGHKCPMCKGTGNVDDGPGYELALCEDGPEKLKTSEQALILALSANLSTLADALKLDATQIEVHVEFKATKHRQGFRLRLAQKR